MSTPRDPDGFGDRPGDGSEWREPSHLGGAGPDSGPEAGGPEAGGPASGPEDGGQGGEPNFADRRHRPRDDVPVDRDAWQPPGWDLPAATSGAGADQSADAPRPPATAAPEQPRASPFGGRPRSRDPETARVFTYEGDLVGAQGWAVQHGWTVSDGSAPEDAVLRELVVSAPVRPSKDHRPASVLRGRGAGLELVAFDVVYVSGRYVVPQWAVTAAPVLGTVPRFRLSPARFWKHGIGGMLPIASGNEYFDARWQLLAVEDGPQVRKLVADPVVQGLLMGSDDGDEFWSAAGHVAAIRPDGHRPQLIEHHTRLLAAVVGALAAGY
ncbi:MAG: uncharacterized protein JWQ45_1630 [Blastococcus sp.]|nr:uncharacterized protein [Blastococcus sp.]